MSIEDDYINRNGHHIPILTTKERHLQILWKDGLSTWEPLCDLKKSHLIEVAEYAVANKLALQPAFAWWVHYVLKKRNRIISVAESRRKKKNRTLVLKFPTRLKEHWQSIGKTILITGLHCLKRKYVSDPSS